MIDFPRTYKALNQQVFSNSHFKLVPIRYEDRYKIMQWRNEQMYHLRQVELLTKDKQDDYFDNVVAKLFGQEQPGQILFSFLQDNKLIGYGGLVHINWIDRNAEISFIMNTALEYEYFDKYWTVYLDLIEDIAFTEFHLHKIYTYAFDLRPQLYKVLDKNEYKLEARLKEHSFFDSKFIDVLINSKLNNRMCLRLADKSDLKITFKWLNDSKIRAFSFSKEKVSFENHQEWFENKIKDSKCTYFIAEIEKKSVGSFRIDEKNNEGIISFLLDSSRHGQGLGLKLLKEGIKKVNEIKPDLKLIGFVLKQNKASIILFEKLGFIKYDLGENLLKYIKE